MSQTLKIRDAIEDDINEILDLMDQLGYSTSKEEFIEIFKKFTATPDYGVVVADYNNQVAGWLAWSKSQLFVVDKTRYHIEGIIVNPKYRGLGIGEKLMRFVEDIASNSPSIVDLTSGLRREKDGSHEFYKKLGYRNEGIMAKLYLRKEF